MVLFLERFSSSLPRADFRNPIHFEMPESSVISVRGKYVASSSVTVSDFQVICHDKTPMIRSE